MATTQIIDNYSNNLINTVETAFTATVDTVVEAFTASNTSDVNASYSAYIKTTTGGERAQIPFKIVVWNNNDLGIGLVGQVIPAGGELRLKTSALASIYFTVTGREIT